MSSESLSSWLVPGAPTPALRATYLAQNEVVFGDALVSSALVDALYAEACALEPEVVRKYVPGIRKAGSVSYHALREEAPSTLALYHSRTFIAWLEAIIGRRLIVCPERDPHACALYFYTEAGDHVGWHYDHCHYRGERFTVLLGLFDESSGRLLAEVKKDGAPPEQVAIATRPGTVVVFNGDRLHHAVSPIAHGERRVVLTLEYVTDPRMRPWRRLIAAVKDAFGYFGLRQWIFGRRGRRRTPPERTLKKTDSSSRAA